MTQAPAAPARTRAQIPERTFRKDPWWKAPRIVAAGLPDVRILAVTQPGAGYFVFPPSEMTPGAGDLVLLLGPAGAVQDAAG